MFDIGMPEAVLIGIAALLFFGPKRLPELAKNIGGSIKAFKQGLKEGFAEEPEVKPEDKTKP